MRLLHIIDGENFSLVEKFGVQIPPYAILSHTWGADEDEVTFRDIIDNTGRHKSGYSKLRFCAKQATRDNLKHIWVDTCCIDKTSSAELSEAINSFFRWYRNAAKAYVYLSDVTAEGFQSDDQSFENATWHVRGWCLQELIAPKDLSFYSVEGALLGDKRLLASRIASITNIPTNALQGTPLPQFSIEERLSWASKRITKREEDSVYCLFGLFEVHMPLLYGEGRTNAYRRLQYELNRTAFGMNSITPRKDSASNHTSTAYFNYEPTATGQVVFPGSVHEHVAGQAKLKILDSLRFPQMQERKHQIHEPHSETFRWILDPELRDTRPWDDVVAWISSSTEQRRIYWVHGKPGAGKSTLMRFLDRNINPSVHMIPWASDSAVLCAQHYIWSPGSELQKSIVGLLRALLLQLLEARPDLMEEVVETRVQAASQALGRCSVDWTLTELQEALKCYMSLTRNTARVFMLIDGLDELSDSEDAKESMIGFLIQLSQNHNVKICLSSRSWNEFHDAFQSFPQLRLDNLTTNDIGTYVQAQLHNHPRYRHFLRRNTADAISLEREIVKKSAGVFLWVCIVVREMLKGLRDGEDLRKLNSRLLKAPADMNSLFRNLWAKISPSQREESSALLQIALHEEKDFAAVSALTLADLCFVGEGSPNFLLDPEIMEGYDFKDSEAREFHMQSTLRYVNSRCMGMLECVCNLDSWSVLEEDDPDTGESQRLLVSLPANEMRHAGSITGTSGEDETVLVNVYHLDVYFLHRSCRDFLRDPEIESMLHQLTGGKYDAILYLLNAKIAQFIALVHAGAHQQALAMSSYILSSLGRPSYKNSQISVTFAQILQSPFEKLMESRPQVEDFWYIHPSSREWEWEGSSFLTLAIDFDLIAYVKAYLTADRIHRKRGRPILDYILRPRFWMPGSTLKIGYRRQNLGFVRLALDGGADPNELFESCSVWARFLCYVATKRTLDDPVVLAQLLRSGAHAELPKSWLSQEAYYDDYFSVRPESTVLVDPDRPEKLFASRWGSIRPIAMPVSQESFEEWYAVSDLIETFRSFLGDFVDELKKIIVAQH